MIPLLKHYRTKLFILLCCMWWGNTSLFAGSITPAYPIQWGVQIIPYGTDNSVSGPFLQGQFYTDKIVVELSYGVSYQDVFHLTVVNSNHVLGIKTYLRQSRANVFFVTATAAKTNLRGMPYTRIKGLVAGAQSITTFFNKKFNTADPTLTPRGHTVGESYLYYPTDYVNTNFTTTYLHFGFGNQRVFWDETDKKGRIREWYYHLLLTIPPGISYSHVNQNGEAFTGVAERSYKNLVGGSVGLRWMSLSPIGWIIGCETGMRPGLCHADATYGTGTDIGALGNFYFDFKLGCSIGVLAK